MRKEDVYISKVSSPAKGLEPGYYYKGTLENGMVEVNGRPYTENEVNHYFRSATDTIKDFGVNNGLLSANGKFVMATLEPNFKVQKIDDKISILYITVYGHRQLGHTFNTGDDYEKSLEGAKKAFLENLNNVLEMDNILPFMTKKEDVPEVYRNKHLVG